MRVCAEDIAARHVPLKIRAVPIGFDARAVAVIAQQIIFRHERRHV